MSKVVRILGIDPGSQVTGYGLIDVSGVRYVHVASGCIRLPDAELPERLHVLFVRLTELVDAHQPAEVAVERVFMHRNADSALKLGQARGAALSATFSHDVSIHEYAAREVKKAVAGNGGADKAQVQHMVRVLLSLSGQLQHDAADALAVALCHAHARGTAALLRAAVQGRR